MMGSRAHLSTGCRRGNAMIVSRTHSVEQNAGLHGSSESFKLINANNTNRGNKFSPPLHDFTEARFGRHFVRLGFDNSRRSSQAEQIIAREISWGWHFLNYVRSKHMWSTHYGTITHFLRKRVIIGQARDHVWLLPIIYQGHLTVVRDGWIVFDGFGQLTLEYLLIQSLLVNPDTHVEHGFEAT